MQSLILLSCTVYQIQDYTNLGLHCLDKVQSSVCVCVFFFMCVGLASLERRSNGIFSAGTGQAAPTGDE